MSQLLTDTISSISPLDEGAMAQAKARLDILTKPPGSLGRLEELAVRLAGIQARPLPQIKEKVVIVMAGDHGVVVEKVGNWPQEVTAQMVLNFLRGGAGINVLARLAGARVVVVDMGVAAPLDSHVGLVSRRVAPGTQNMCRGRAMTPEQAVRAIEHGIEILNGEVAKGLDIVGTGDMGIGNTTASSALCAVMCRKPPAEVTGRGTGLTDEQLAHKVAVLERALARHCPDPNEPLDTLSRVGGFEIAGLAGVMLGAAAKRVPVVLDGFISGAAALIATGLCPPLRDYLIAAHLSVEPGHRIMLRHLGQEPLLDLGLRLGEGTGAALGIFLAEAAARVLGEMATFAQAGVSQEDKPPA